MSTFTGPECVPVVTGGMVGLGAGLRHLLEGPPSDFGRQLWQASTLLQQACLRRNWSEVQAALAGQQFEPLQLPAGHQDTNRLYYRIQENLYGSQTAFRHDAYLELAAREHDRPLRADNAVGLACCGLWIQVRQRFSLFASQMVYPADSALARVCGLERVQLAARAYPQLLHVTISYDLIRDRWRRALPSGYWIGFSLARDAARADDESPEVSPRFTVESRRSPLRDWDGNVLAEAHARGEPIRYWGGQGDLTLE